MRPSLVGTNAGSGFRVDRDRCLGVFEECSSTCAAEVISRVESFKSVYASATPVRGARPRCANSSWDLHAPSRGRVHRQLRTNGCDAGLS